MRTEPTCAEAIRRAYPRLPEIGPSSDWLDGLPDAPPYVPPPPDPVYEERLAQIVAILEPYLNGLDAVTREARLEQLEDAVDYIACGAPPG